MKNEKKNLFYKLMLAITLIGWGSTLMYFSISHKDINKELDGLQSEVIELQQSLEAYAENYVALWNTINNQR